MKACVAATKLNIDILNDHALGGKDMMVTAKEAIKDNQIKLIGVTLLTSHDKSYVEEIGLVGSNLRVTDKIK